MANVNNLQAVDQSKPQVALPVSLSGKQSSSAVPVDVVSNASQTPAPIPSRSPADDPLASPNVPAPKSADSNIWDYPFPGPGLVYYAAQAAALQIETDMNAMKVYANMEQSEYVIINNELNTQAIQDRNSIQQQATSTMWNAVASMGMGAASAVGGGFGMYKMSSLTNDQINLNNDLSQLEGQLSNKFELNQADLNLNQNGNGLEETINDQRSANLRKVTFQKQAAEDLRNLALTRPNDWEGAVNNYFNNNAIDTDGLSNESRQRLQQEQYASRVKLLNNPPDDLSNEEINAAFDDMQKDVNKQDDLFERKKTLEKEPIQSKIDEVNRKLKVNERDSAKAQNYIQMGQGFGNLLQGLNFGSYNAQMNQAEANYAKTKTQQLSQTNESIRQEVGRQWSALAQAKDASLQSFNQVVREINAVIQRA